MPPKEKEVNTHKTKNEEPEKEEREAITASGEAGSFLTPEAVLMLTTAIFVDAGEVLVEFIPVIGQIASIVIDVIAVIIFGAWMWLRSGTITVSRKTMARIGKMAKWAKRMKWLRPLCFIIECIPFVGSLPLWILVVYMEIKHNS
ncbi:MAG: hypothetical protein CO144_02005 [Candidatus Nealsonbacteria bacterium CG_4_9_14_3_um_filter_35_11]|uniref:Uncharacterized protein n=2 Tax=Candidatus Nealsoniibacteriota TaxID=1817911 RepID=A0A2M7DBH2_9BACT|nr:MAG: hypothetical protein COV62_00605 [Candidatus Nealsonbacteria bacterium CG11_big_fil_rev_8_21_14_0_20_35_11]PIV45801.1 MAG: hypothetical protein COS24_00295 [Candidatus Nealsonbacteria bacterium CG02_land_8_20_14_3_00_34_20]PIW92430.1 MAG: hypothetical protein COZ88_02365 [Candidatus Nealsonbacteria bacterium CG_4_8_14_3_um_filter_34_13]PIZ89813.1 MAG: hypothetical protein COX88_01840 [Candidatus Nealsonbacteria bacterium CG_4_10_14_0_2_um_filter_35_20]PJA84362.1 MAG: hypothetical protei